MGTLNKRKAKVYKHQVLAGRRRADRARREQRRAQRQQDEKARRQFRFRVRVVRYYHQLMRQDGMTEPRAVELTVEKYRPRKKEHQPLSASTLRNWVRQVKPADGHYGALWPHSRRPHQITYHVSETVVSIIFTLRHQLGWGGGRMAQELKKRQIAQVSQRTVYPIFDRLGLPIKLYALKGRSDGIAYQRYEQDRPNAQWHIDLKSAWLADGEVLGMAHSRHLTLAPAAYGTVRHTQFSMGLCSGQGGVIQLPCLLYPHRVYNLLRLSPGTRRTPCASSDVSSSFWS